MGDGKSRARRSYKAGKVSNIEGAGRTAEVESALDGVEVDVRFIGELTADMIHRLFTNVSAPEPRKSSRYDQIIRQQDFRQ